MEKERKTLTLGSLFDGSGGFPLGGALVGITPIWASEIEPFPIRVTTKRLPSIKHYGDISKLSGAELEPVDIITFGSPCQDMSVAGKRVGLDGERSGLFHQALRIVKEMREKTNGKYPRYIVWENVYGAYSSSGGNDFRAVLEEICRVCDPTVSIPRPPSGKWTKAGEIMGDGYSVAWRGFDAQYWGVPQRRKRIYLVADFRGGSARKILFESEGVSRYTTAGFDTWQTATTYFERCFNQTSECEVEELPYLFDNHGQATRYKGPIPIAPPVTATFGMGGNNQPFVVYPTGCYDVRFSSVNSKVQRNHCYETDVARTISTDGNLPHGNHGGIAIVYGISAYQSNAMKSSNPHSGVYEATTTRTLDLTGSNPSCHQGGMLVVNRVVKDASELTGSENAEACVVTEQDTTRVEDVTLPHAPIFTIPRTAFNGGINFVRHLGISTEGINPTLVASGPSAVGLPWYTSSKDSFHTRVDLEKSGTLVATDYKDPPIVYIPQEDKVECSQYIIRRLTPKECAKLQGFPSWWASGLEEDNPTASEIEMWQEVFKTHAEVLGKQGKPKSENQIRKWLKDPHSDSAEYKMWGNGVALPNVVFVLAGIEYFANNEE